MKIWITDPTTQKPSVSLTLLCLATVLMVLFIGLEAFELMKSTSLLDEFWGSACALYFGRRFTARGQSFDGSAITNQLGNITGQPDQPDKE